MKQVAELLINVNPKLFSYSIGHTSPHQLTARCGLVDGQVESLAALKPVFVCHDSLTDQKRYGCFLPMGTDPQYPHIVYMVDLQADLSGLLEEAGENVTRFIKTRQDQFDKPILRLNLNRIPFISPVEVVDEDVAARLKIDMAQVAHNVALLRHQQELCLALLEESGASETSLNADPEFQLYGAEYLPSDKALLERLHKMPFESWEQLLLNANDPRIPVLGKRLISRFAAPLLKEDELFKWQAHCRARLIGKADPARIQSISDYCRSVLAGVNSPQGMRDASQHWMNIIETRDERSHNL